MMNPMTQAPRRRTAQEETVLLSDIIKEVRKTQQATLRSMIEMEILKGTILAFEIHETFELINGSNRNMVHDMVIRRTRTFQVWLDEAKAKFSTRQSRYYRPTAQMVAVGLADEQTALENTREAIRRRRRTLPEHLIQQRQIDAGSEQILNEAAHQKGGRAPLSIQQPARKMQKAPPVELGQTEAQQTPSTSPRDTPEKNEHLTPDDMDIRGGHAATVESQESSADATPVIAVIETPAIEETVMSAEPAGTAEDQQEDVNAQQTQEPQEAEASIPVEAPAQIDIAVDELDEPEVTVSAEGSIQADQAETYTQKAPEREEVPAAKNEISTRQDLLTLASDEEEVFELYNPEETPANEENAAPAPKPNRLTLDDLDSTNDTEDSVFDWSS